MISEAEDMRILTDSAALRDAIALAIAIRLYPSPLCWPVGSERNFWGSGKLLETLV